MSLWDTYTQMVKEAEAQAPEATQKVADEEMEVLSKYASWAEEVLTKEKGEGNFTEEEVEKLATAQLEADAYETIQREKVAEAYEMGQIMYEGFKAAAEADNK